MSQRHQQLADNVLVAFRENLGDEDRRCIGEAAFQQLHGLILEALSLELDHVSGQMEALLQTLRADIDKPSLEL
jgi:hypothetical protein